MSSRSYDEYVAMFDLTDADVHGRRLLDCSAGGASFARHARAAGSSVVAVDPAYALRRDVLAETIGASNRSGSGIAAQHADRFTWQWYGSEQARDRMRARALAEFVMDVTTNPSTYVAAALPRLPFRDRAFDLALCSHLLFTWADQLGPEWHEAALRELARVAGEVRIFPTVVQGRGDPVPFWDELMRRLGGAGLRTQLRQVPYEFQVGANTMLVLAHDRG